MHTSKKPEIQNIPVSTRITEPMQKAIEKILLINAHINTSDYLRDLIRKDLEKRRLLDDQKPQGREAT
jgi:Arc/MetJ-type ribon-helix-helix transcriptional regulator